VTNATATATSELLAELHGLCERLRVPQPGWHSYVPQIAACRSDFEQALAIVTERPAALERVAAQVDGDAEPAFAPVVSPDVAAARQRLEALPRPSGRHPYLDEILPALDALRLVLVALSQTAG